MEGIVTANNKALSEIDLSSCELTTNKVTQIESTSTDTEYPSAKAVFDAIENGNSIPTVEDLNTFVPTTTIVDDYTCVTGIITSNTLNKNNFENYFVCTYLYYDGDDSYEIYQFVYASVDEFYDRSGYGNSIQEATEHLATDSFVAQYVLTKDIIKKTDEFDSYKNFNGYIPSCKAVTDHFIEQSNKVTSVDSSSTDEQVPSAKCVYDTFINKSSVIYTNDTSVEPQYNGRVVWYLEEA